MKRPRVICHMVATVDGRIAAEGWPDTDAVRHEYELVHASYKPEGWICGRVTMEPFAKGTRSERAVRREYTGRKPREDYRAPGDQDSFAFAIDARGRLAWKSNDISGDHVVAILCGRVSDDYLGFLRERGVSYIFAGKQEIDLKLALEKIGEQFGVRTLMLEGGGKINGGMLRDGLIDEVSLLVAPIADGRIGSPALFDVDSARVTPHRLRLEAFEKRTKDILWLRYAVTGAKGPPSRKR